MNSPQERIPKPDNGIEAARRPLYRSVADTLRRDLTNGKLAPGSKLPPVRNLADQFNVSVITVSKAIRALEQEGHLTCIPAVGAFVPAALIPAATAKQVAVAFATVEIEGALTGWIAAGIEEACRHRGWLLHILNAQADPRSEADALSRLPKTGTRGAIILPLSDDANIETLFWLKFNKFPFVLVDRRIAGLRADIVESAHEQGGYVATRHLLEHGHRRVLMLTSRPGLFSSADERLLGYEKALQEAGIEPRPEWKITFDDRLVSDSRPPWTGWYDHVLPVLKRMELPTAIFAMNSYAARGLLEACRDLNLNVPQDVSVVSFDDTEYMEGYHPPITVVVQRHRQIGQVAVDLLERRMQSDSRQEPQHVRIDVDLIERKSVCRPSAG